MKKEVRVVILLALLLAGCSATQAPDSVPAFDAENITETASAADANPVSNQKSSGMFVAANPINLSQIARISKFRSCIGHDYSGFNAVGKRKH